MLEQLYFERFYLCGQFSNFLPVLLVALLEQQYVAALLLLVAVVLQRGPVQRQLRRLCESKVFSTFPSPSRRPPALTVVGNQNVIIDESAETASGKRQQRY